MVVFTLLMAMGIGGAFAIIEGSPLGDGLWWAIVTVTTVGYGDMFPITPAGRLAASIVDASRDWFRGTDNCLSVAAHFVEEDEEDGPDLATEVDRLHQRLDSMEALLLDRTERQRE